MKKLLSVLLLLAVMLASVPAMADGTYGVWNLKAYVDEFDMPTDNYYVVTTASGHFSNSATSNSNLDAVIFFNNWSDAKTAYVKIRLFKYGNTRVSNYSSKNDEYYDVLVMDTEGNKVSLSGYIGPKDYDMVFYNFFTSGEDDNSKLVKILTAGSGTVRFSITERDNSLNKYVFAIDDISGLKEACEAGNLNMNP